MDGQRDTLVFNRHINFDAKYLKTDKEILSAKMWLVMSLNEINGKLINGATEY